ncbi:MAG TPA: type VI secretion system tube protein TssD [Polyangiaceae bacterium]
MGKAKTQGDLIGGSKKKEGDLDFSKGMECHGFEQKVEAQTDPNSGLTVGRRRHHPLVIRKEVDAASPLLFNALCTNEILPTCKFSFNKADQAGKQKVYYTIELVNAVVSSYRNFHAQDVTSREKYDTNEQEEVELTFQKITVTWVDGGKTAVDDWLNS